MQFIAALLVLFLTFVFTVPIAFAQESAAGWDEFYIIRQPQNLTFSKNESFTLSVEVNVPEGLEVEYRWLRDRHADSSSIGNTAILHLGPGDSGYPFFSVYDSVIANSSYYYCEITAYEKNDEGTVLSSKTLTSDIARATVKQSFWGKLFSVTLQPFALGFSAVYASTMMSFGIALPFAPLIFLFGLIGGFYTGFQGLLS